MSITWLIFETMGTIAFAFSGAMTGLSRRMDVFGVTVLAVMTGIGGGMIRDVLAGITPPSALRSPTGLLLSIATALAVSLLYEFGPISRRSKQWIAMLYTISDTCGLAAFTVTGALTSLYAHPEEQYVMPVMLGLITAIGGGIIRDMMAQRVPLVLRTDVYALASIAGGLAVCAAWQLLSVTAASWIGFILVLLLRAAAIFFHWQLYHPHPGFHKKVRFPRDGTPS